MNNFKKTLFLFIIFAGQASSTGTPKKIAAFTIAALAANIGVAECTTQYNNEATQKLWRAIANDDLIAAQKAIDEGANPNGTEEQNFLILATNLHYCGMVHLLLLNKADVNVKCKFSGLSPLMIACISGRVQTVEAFLYAGADYSIKDSKHQKTALEMGRSFRAFSMRKPYS